MTSTSHEDQYVTTSLTWRGIEIEVRYAACWLGNDDTAHLEVRSVAPENAKLPMTETGYRSHFEAPELVDEVGGPADYVSLWLEQEADTKRWRELEEKARQYTLF